MLVPIVLVVSLATFALMLAVPGDAAAEIAGPNATPEQIDRIREQLGLDQPVLVQYLAWLGNLFQGNLGNSLMSGREVSAMLVERLPVTLSLSLLALLIGTVFGVIFGVIAALTRGSVVDRSVTMISALGIATPNYWLGLLLILLFAITLRWLPSSQYVPLGDDPVQWLRHLILPSLALGAAFVAETARQVRSAMLEVKDLAYITTAKAHGHSSGAIVSKYMAKNAALPVLTVIGLQFTRILGGAVLIEQIFSLPGIGTLMISAVLNRDMPVVQGVMFCAVIVAVLINLIVDLSYAALNPKVRTQWS